MLGLCGTLSFAVFVYLCICVFVLLYLCVWHMWITYLIPLNNPIFKNIPYVGSWWHFVICRICVFAYLCIWIFCIPKGTSALILLFSLSKSFLTARWTLFQIDQGAISPSLMVLLRQHWSCKTKPGLVSCIDLCSFTCPPCLVSARLGGHRVRLKLQSLGFHFSRLLQPWNLSAFRRLWSDWESSPKHRDRLD